MQGIGVNWFRAQIEIKENTYVMYLMAVSIHAAKLDIIARFGRRLTATAKYKEIFDRPLLRKIKVELNDGRKFELLEYVCNDEHAECLCYQKYKKRNIKNIEVCQGI